MGQRVTAVGAINPLDDLDYWVIEIPAGQTASIAARTHSALQDPNSCVGVDTKIRLSDENGVALAENDDIDVDAGIYCSAIDGLGADMGAARLEAGRYFLTVQHWDGSATIP